MSTAYRISADLAVLAEDRRAAWRLVESFAADWSPRPLGPGDGCDDASLDEAEQRLGMKLPVALREAYGLLGRRDDLARNHDTLLRPDALFTYEGALVYHVENQGAANWGIMLSDLGHDDPPTVCRPDLADKASESWDPWTDRLSTALVELVMTETVKHEDDGLSDACEPPDGALDAFQALPSVLPERFGSRWYLGDQVILHCLEDWWLTVRARTPEPLESVREAVHGDWING